MWGRWPADWFNQRSRAPQPELRQKKDPAYQPVRGPQPAWGAKSARFTPVGCGGPFRAAAAAGESTHKTSGPVALPPMRAGAPGRREGGKLATLPRWKSAADRDLALQEFRRDIWAASTTEVNDMKMRTVYRAFHRWGIPPFPPTLDKVYALGASLKRGAYRTPASYLSDYKGEAERRGYPWDAVLQRGVRDSIRSCMRGLGPPVQAQPLPLRDLSGLPAVSTPWTDRGPANPRNAMVIGSWLMLREMELSTLRAASVAVRGSAFVCGSVVVSLTLPVSKTDQQAFGTTRSHRCRCTGPALPDCPAHAVLDQLLWLRRVFPRRHRKGVPALDLPLFPTLGGEVVEKGPMVHTIEAAGHLLGVRPPPDGTERVSGHSLRTTGAQGLIELGWRADAVRLMGRWTSHHVDRYTRLAPLAAPTGLAAAEGDLRALFVKLCGLAPDPIQVPDAAPEPPEPSDDEWIMNGASNIYHLASATTGRTRCGWRYAQAWHGRGSPPPPWAWVVCGTCAPALRRLLAEQAPSAAP